MSLIEIVNSLASCRLDYDGGKLFMLNVFARNVNFTSEFEDTSLYQLMPNLKHITITLSLRLKLTKSVRLINQLDAIIRKN